MKKSARLLVMLCLSVTAFAAAAQSAPPPPPPGYYGQMPRGPMRDLSPEQREQWREERRQQRREEWREMSPEDRHQLRRDIRDAGRLYPRGPRHRD